MWESIGMEDLFDSHSKQLVCSPIENELVSELKFLKTAGDELFRFYQSKSQRKRRFNLYMKKKREIDRVKVMVIGVRAEKEEIQQKEEEAEKRVRTGEISGMDGKKKSETKGEKTKLETENDIGRNE